MSELKSEPNKVSSLKPIPHPRHYQPLQAVTATEDRQPHLLPAFKIRLATAVTKHNNLSFRVIRRDTKLDLPKGSFKIRSLKSYVKPLSLTHVCWYLNPFSHLLPKRDWQLFSSMSYLFWKLRFYRTMRTRQRGSRCLLEILRAGRKKLPSTAKLKRKSTDIGLLRCPHYSRARYGIRTA
jgi:hypothetical protein